MHMCWTCEIRKKEWELFFKEIRKIIGCNIQISPIIALLNMIKNDHLKKRLERVSCIMVAILIFAKN